MSSDEPAAKEPQESPGEPSDSRDETEGTTSGGPPKWLTFGSAALALAALVTAVYFGISWWVTSGKEASGVAAEREDVVRSTGTAVVALTELDFEDPDAYFQRQREIATGDLLEQMNQNADQYRKTIAEAKTKVVSTVQDVGVQELDVSEGKASVLATVRTEVAQGEQKGTKVLRLELEMVRVDDKGTWKLSNIGEVPIAQAGQ
ncbi:hypothetical protein ABZ639_22860 [Saccharomonospora sp. NPDC006951]